MKKKITLEELEKRIEALENNRIVYVPQYPIQQPYQPLYSPCTCNILNGGICPVHGIRQFPTYSTVC